MPLVRASCSTTMIFLAVCKSGTPPLTAKKGHFFTSTNVMDIIPTDPHCFSRGSLRPENYFNVSSGVKSLRKTGLDSHHLSLCLSSYFRVVGLKWSKW